MMMTTPSLNQSLLPPPVMAPEAHSPLLSELQRQVLEANRAKKAFLANMSHELRTPLNAIVGFSELLYDGKLGDLDEQHREYLGHILAGSRQLLQLINDILDLSRVDSGEMTFDADSVDLDQLARQVRDILRSPATRKRLRISIDVDPDIGGVVSDISRLKQILYNYLSNAIKFTPDGGRISIRVEPAQRDMFRISVEDTGVGVRGEDVARLFVEFEQLDLTAAKVHQGSGLGLALTRRIVEAQGGSVDVRTVPGHGSTFSATLPRRPARAAVFSTSEQK